MKICRCKTIPHSTFSCVSRCHSSSFSLTPRNPYVNLLLRRLWPVGKWFPSHWPPWTWFHPDIVRLLNIFVIRSQTGQAFGPRADRNLATLLIICLLYQSKSKASGVSVSPWRSTTVKLLGKVPLRFFRFLTSSISNLESLFWLRIPIRKLWVTRQG